MSYNRLISFRYDKFAGKYRTGKSYLMNRLAGGNSGFGLGDTIQSETKGIWMWAKPHPQVNFCIFKIKNHNSIIHFIEYQIMHICICFFFIFGISNQAQSLFYIMLFTEL